jgi:hypothetical protein
VVLEPVEYKEVTGTENRRIGGLRNQSAKNSFMETAYDMGLFLIPKSRVKI